MNILIIRPKDVITPLAEYLLRQVRFSLNVTDVVDPLQTSPRKLHWDLRDAKWVTESAPSLIVTTLGEGGAECDDIRLPMVVSMANRFQAALNILVLNEDPTVLKQEDRMIYGCPRSVAIHNAPVSENPGMVGDYFIKSAHSDNFGRIRWTLGSKGWVVEALGRSRR